MAMYLRRKLTTKTSHETSLVIWMDHSINRSNRDPVLFDGLSSLLAQNQRRNVSLIEGTDLLLGAITSLAQLPEPHQQFVEMCGKKGIKINEDNFDQVVEFVKGQMTDA
jgi:hypothetical protein